MKLKLSEEAPEQHMAVLGIAAVMIIVALVTSLGRSSSKPGVAAPTESAQPGAIRSKYRNPELSWYERLFCRGYQVSSLLCRPRFLHPMVEEFGLDIEDGQAKTAGVIRYRGPISRNRVDGKVVLDNYD